MLALYAVLTVGMLPRSDCHFDRSLYDSSKPNMLTSKTLTQMPNLASSVQLSFVIALTLHMLLFIVDVFFEPHLFYFTLKQLNEAGGKKDFLAEEDPRKKRQKLENFLQNMKAVANWVDLSFRVLILGQTSF